MPCDLIYILSVLLDSRYDLTSSMKCSRSHYVSTWLKSLAGQYSKYLNLMSQEKKTFKTTDN